MHSAQHCKLFTKFYFISNIHASEACSSSSSKIQNEYLVLKSTYGLKVWFSKWNWVEYTSKLFSITFPFGSLCLPKNIFNEFIHKCYVCFPFEKEQKRKRMKRTYKLWRCTLYIKMFAVRLPKWIENAVKFSICFKTSKCFSPFMLFLLKSTLPLKLVLCIQDASKLRKLFDSIQYSNAENKWKFKHLNLAHGI